VRPHPLGQCAPMPLSAHMAKVVMTYPCPQCGHPLVKEGSWFKTASNYMCASCGTAVQMTYAAKLRLFAMYDRQQTKPT
jgi:predicted RNA-binding Zn-ribbon protein involved in translation (DUF1610 family)